MNIYELKKQQEQKISELFNECSVFFAFTDKQFDENKTPIADDDKYVRFASGSYVPKSNLKKLHDGFDTVDKWFNDSINDEKLRYELIAYELGNHESYYTGSISDALAALGTGFTRDEVYKVYLSELPKQPQD